MQINIDKNVVEFTPENKAETASMEVLWRVIIDCIKESKKLVPIGEYVPSKQNLARFVIEGTPGGKTNGQTRFQTRTAHTTAQYATST